MSRISLQFFHQPYDFDAGSAAFKPLTVPDAVRVGLESLNADALHEATLELGMALAAGRHELPLSRGVPCQIDVPEGCRLDLDAGVGRSSDGQAPLIHELRGRFNRPIVFRNIISTLDELRTVFRDHVLGGGAAEEAPQEIAAWAIQGIVDLARQVELRFDASRSFSALKSLLPRTVREWGPSGLALALKASEQRLDGLLAIHLDGFRALSARKKGGRRELHFYFDGHVQLFDQVSIPFRRIRLPAFILPTLHARIDDLLKGNPLASADLLRERVPHAQLLRAMLGLPERVEVQLSAVGVPPLVSAALQTFNRSALEVEVAVPASAQLSGKFEGRRVGGALELEGKGVEISLGARRMLVDVEGRAEIEELVALASNAAPDGSSMTLRVAPPLSTPDPAAARVKLRLREGAQLGPVQTRIRVEHPVARGVTSLAAGLQDLQVSGTCELAFDARRQRLVPSGLDLRFAALLSTEPGSSFDVGSTRVTAKSFSGHVQGTAGWRPGSALKIALDTDAEVTAQALTRIDPLPELAIPDGRLEVAFQGGIALSGGITVGGPAGRPGIDFEGSRANLAMSACRVSLDGMQLVIPAGTAVDAEVVRGFMNASGLGELEVGLGWDLQGKSAVLESGGRRAELLVEELRKMQVSARISPAGKLSFTGGNPGLYDGDYLNALLDPLAHQKKWLEILDNDAAMERVLAAADLLSAEAGKWARRAREELIRARRILTDEGVRQPGDIIPRDTMAHVLARVLVRDTEAVQRLEPRLAAIVKGVTDGAGLDRRALEQIVNELFPDHSYAFELDRLLRWADLLLRPATPLPPPKVQRHAPLVEKHRDLVDALPSARELYAAVAGKGPIDAEAAEQVVRYAPWLGREQLNWIVERGGERFGPAHRSRLLFVQELKRRVDLIARGYGGIGYAPQAMAISFFLADVLEAGPRYLGGLPPAGKRGDPLPGRGVLAPEDAAVLLQASLSTVAPSRTAQINQRMLLTHLLAQPRLFFIGVLSEMGMRSPRVLTNVLLKLLNDDQRHMRDPIDLAGALTHLFGFDVPRRSDYMAGGRWAKKSYYAALMAVSEKILEIDEPYEALKMRLQGWRHPVPEQRRASGVANLESLAQGAIARADELAGRCTFGASVEGPAPEARAAYEEAFDACRSLIARDRHAFQRDWLKRFWFRNHEALVVRSVVRNYQQEVDRVRPWLHVRTGKEAFETEQQLIDAVIGSLYFFKSDREQLLADPLVRLLIDPPHGRYDLTVVSAMGVVTEGGRGRELEAAFERLQQAYGVGLVRADTGTAKPLEYNAARVIEAIEKVRTPYGLIGYSQGCANALMAEAMLHAGTPGRQKLLEGLRCRNFLFSAANGSAHGSCSNAKYLRAMVEGEDFLKYFQAIFSSAVIENFSLGLNTALSSPFTSVLLGSVESLSHEGVVALARDGQFRDDVPTSSVRGAVIEAIVPEALEMLSNVITKQVEGALHDTQVTLVSSVGYPDRVASPSAEVLKRCDIGSFAQISHHWSPLLHETAFVTTKRDRERAIYDFPKDRHVFPWIEVNARFGTVAVSRAAQPARAEAPTAPEPKKPAKKKRKSA